MKPKDIFQLEKILTYWESMCFVLKANSLVSMLSGSMPENRIAIGGPLLNAPQFRKHLLTSIRNEFDARRFVGLGNFGSELEEKFSAMHTSCLYELPRALFQWSKSSRRVFKITPDLHFLLLSTAIGDFTWESTPWPFPAFVMLLEAPLVYEDKVFDCILVSSTPILQIRLFSRDFQEQVVFSKTLQDSFMSAVQNRRMFEVQRLYNEEIAKHYVGKIAPASVMISIGSERMDEQIQKFVNGTALSFDFGEDLQGQPVGGEPDDLNGLTIRLVVGLCLYLKSLPSNNTVCSDWQKMEPVSEDKLAISSEAQVCTVSSVYELGPDEKAIVAKLSSGTGGPTLFEMKAHFRRAFWRRAPGTGNDPNAPRIVHVKWCIVRRDRLKTDTLPSGTEVRLSM